MSGRTYKTVDTTVIRNGAELSATLARWKRIADGELKTNNRCGSNQPIGRATLVDHGRRDYEVRLDPR